MASSVVTVALKTLPMASQSYNNLSFSQNETLGSLSFYTHNLTTIQNTPSISLSSTSSPPTLPLVYCGRGDRKTARGKRFNHSFGNARPHKKKNGRGPPRVPVDPSPFKKDKFENDEIIHIDIDESLFTS